MATGHESQRNLKAILKWSLAQQGDGTQETHVDVECQKWLKEAINDLLSQPSESDLLKAAITVLKVNAGNEVDEESKEMLEATFDQVLYLVEDLDHASDLIKVGGVEVMLEYLVRPDTRSCLLTATCGVIAAASQNHPVCQTAFLPAMVRLFEIVVDAHLPPETRTKALYAISCLCRGFEPGQQELYRNDRFLTLLDCLHSDVHKLVIKTLFLFGRIYSSGSSEGPLKKYLPTTTKEVIALLERSCDVEIIGHAVMVLLTLSKFHIEQGLQLEQDCKLREVLQFKQQLLLAKEYKGEVEAIDQLLKHIQ